MITLRQSGYTEVTDYMQAIAYKKALSPTIGESVREKGK
jgi:hypothetical protein